jgi:hypothetical protein
VSDFPISFVEQRTYALAVGQTAAYFKLYQAEGLPLQLEILQRLVGYYSVEVGGLNTVTHLWAYASLEERELRRARLLAHPGWQAYWAQARNLIVNQQSTFLKPAPFFASRLSDMLGAVRAEVPFPT